MKNILLGMLAILLALPAWAQESQPAEGPQITFIKKLHDFEDIHQGDKVHVSFEFENTGNEDLILANVLTTCGCTAPEWPREPIPPGEKRTIEVHFNSAGKMGKVNKTITIVSNALNEHERVRITANVLPPKRD